MGERRQEATDQEVDAAIKGLDKAPDRISARDWPAHFVGLDQPGLYSWWVDEEGAAGLSEGLGQTIDEGRIYAGLTGATKWPSGKAGSATLSSRIGRNHLNGKIRGSTFRFTLAASLASSLELSAEGSKKLTIDSELKLTEWMRDHLSVAVHPFPEADALENLESRVLHILDPPLNLAGCPPTPTRRSLSSLRSALSNAAPDSKSFGQAPKKAPPGPNNIRKGKKMGNSERVTLHAEIDSILRDNGGSMTTQEIADAVNKRGVYSKKDGSPVTAFQIHGRTRNYPQLFKRDRSNVSLK